MEQLTRDAVTHRINTLKEKWIGTDILCDLYGVTLPDSMFIGAFKCWALQHRKIDCLFKRAPSEVFINRHTLELFLQDCGLLTTHQAATMLGMYKETLDILVQNLLQKYSYIPHPYISDQIISEKFIRNIQRYFYSIKYRVLDEHDTLCEAIHKAAEEEFGSSVSPVLCETASKLSKKHFSLATDCITAEPLGTKYQVWLDFGKPVRLTLDVCSLKTYLQFKDLIKPYIFASGNLPEKIPKDVRMKLLKA